MKREILLRIGLILIGSVVGILLLELVFSICPVWNGPNLAVNGKSSSIVWFEPNQKHTYSKGWKLENVNMFHTNNLGYVSDIDYQLEDDSPLVAIIGDSYVEALMIPSKRTVAAQLRELLTPMRVYSFGVAGAPLSQYLFFAEALGKELKPTILVVVIVANDFDQSLRKYRNIPHFHYFIQGDNDDLALSGERPVISWWQRILRKSSLVNYLYRNLELYNFALRIDQFMSKFMQRSITDSSIRINDSKEAVDAFLRQLPRKSGLKPSEIILVVDGIRSQLYQGYEALRENRGSYFSILREYFLTCAHSAGYQVVDMQPVFIEHYRDNKRRFEFPTDKHWNQFAHRVCAEAVAGVLSDWPLKF